MRTLEQRIEELETIVSKLVSATEPPTHRANPGISMGPSSKIHPTCVMIASNGRNIKIGEGTSILRLGEWIGPISIGRNCFVNRSSYVRANVTIGDNVNIGPFVSIVSDGHDLGPAARRAGKNSWHPIEIGSGTWIGANVTITGGVNIGESCVIAAGAVVASDVPSNTMVGGVPAKVIKYLDGHPRYGQSPNPQ